MGVAEDSTQLRHLFEAAGYRVTERSGGWAAVRSRDRRSVVFSDAVRTPTDLESAFAPDAIHRVLVYPEDPGTVARSLASERGIEIFDTVTIGSALGELLLLPASPSPGAGSAGGAFASLETPPSIFPEGERIVRGRLSRPEAERIAAAPELRATLRLVPFFVAPYRVRTPSPHGGRGASTEHIVAVNGLLRGAEEWDVAQYELTDSPPESHPRLEPTISADEALSVALDWIRANHTVRVEHTEQHGGTVVVETRRVPPSLEDVRIAPLTLVYVPFWYFEGEEGRIVIDAVTGRTRSTPPVQ
jgi:hypothetical protein